MEALHNPSHDYEDDVREERQNVDPAGPSGRSASSPPVVHDHPPGSGEDQLIIEVHQSGINA